MNQESDSMCTCYDMYENATREVRPVSEFNIGYAISDKDMKLDVVKNFYEDESCRMAQYGSTSWGMRGHYLYRRNDGKCFVIVIKLGEIQDCNEISWEKVKAMYSWSNDDDEWKPIEGIDGDFTIAEGAGKEPEETTPLARSQTMSTSVGVDPFMIAENAGKEPEETTPLARSQTMSTSVCVDPFMIAENAGTEPGNILKPLPLVRSQGITSDLFESLFKIEK